MNTIERDVYVRQNKIKEPIDYVQNTNSIQIILNFRDYQIPSGATAQVFVQKPSGKFVYDDAVISGNSVSVNVKTQMMAEVGFANMQIQITQGEENLVTFDQPIRVYENRTDPDAPQSENESSFFEQLQEAAESANQAAQTANDAAQDIQQRAEEGEFSSTISIGNTTTGAPGTQAQVTNTGTDKDPVFNFTIPQGPQGPQGPAGNIDDLEDATVTFNQASTRTNINSGDSVATLFGKIKKWFADLGTAAFQGVSNVLTQTSSGYVLDARQGKTLADRIGTLSSLLTAAKTSLVSAVNELFNKIGDLDDLNTTEKDDIVGAINETNASLSDLSSNSYKLHTGLLGGASTRPYTLKKYNDGTFELCGNLDASAVRLQYSNSSKVYFTTISAQIPEELTIDLDKRTQFSGSVESEGIYYLSVNELTATTLTVYLSAMNYMSEIPYVASGFTLKGWWK